MVKLNILNILSNNNNNNKNKNKKIPKPTNMMKIIRVPKKNIKCYYGEPSNNVIRIITNC